MEWTGKTGGGRIGQKSLLILFRFCDVRLGYFLLRFVIPFYMLLSRKNCQAIIDYFQKRHHYSIWKSIRATYRNHLLFGQMLLDRFAFFAGKRDFEFHIEGLSYFNQSLESDKGCVILSAHLGNFELLGYALQQQNKQIYGLIFDGESPVMQTNRMKILQENNVHLVPIKDDLSHLFVIHHALSHGDLLTILADRSMNDKKKKKYPFLGKEAYFPSGAFHIIQKYDVNVFSVFVLKEKNNSYKVVIRPIHDIDSHQPDQRIETMMAQFVTHLEKSVQDAPEQWFNFYDFWKDSDA